MKKTVLVLLMAVFASFCIIADDVPPSNITELPTSGEGGEKTATFPITLTLDDSNFTETLNAGFLESEVTSLSAASGISEFTSAMSLTEESGTGDFINSPLYFFYYAKTSMDLTVSVKASSDVGGIPWSVTIPASNFGNGNNTYTYTSGSGATDLSNGSVSFKHDPANSIASYACYEVDARVKQADYLNKKTGTYTGNLTIEVSTP